jgi:hypothetical protein
VIQSRAPRQLLDGGWPPERPNKQGEDGTFSPSSDLRGGRVLEIEQRDVETIRVLEGGVLNCPILLYVTLLFSYS